MVASFLAKAAATRRVMPFDRLSIVALLTSIYFLQVWGFIALDPTESILRPENLVGMAMIGLCLLGIVESRLSVILLVNAAVFVVYYLAKSPVPSNNQTMAFFFSATVIAASLPLLIQHRLQVWRIDREALFTAIAGPGRWILAVMYFYGIYHKINADFINPDVSCAVVLYKALVARFGIDGWALGHYGAIWSTFVIEGAAMVLLFSRRFKKIGFIIGVPFHIIIGWSGYGYYMDFSTIVMTTYALFLPAAAPQAAMATATKWAGSEDRALLIMRGLMITAVIALLIQINALSGWRNFVPSWQHYVVVFTVYATLFYAFCIFFVPWRTDDNLPAFNFKPRFAAIVPFLFFINGASPYLGLKTESSIAMFSNLHTEGGVTNHYLTGVLPFGAHYQEDLVRVVSSSDAGVVARTDNRSGYRDINYDIAFVRYEFDRLLALNPEVQIEFMHNGELRTNDETWENTYLSSNWFARHFLEFKTVDFERPKICTH